MTDAAEQSPIAEEDQPPRLGRGTKVLVIVLLVVATCVTIFFGVIFYFLACGGLFCDDVTGKNRTDEEMIQYFQEHRAEFEQLLVEYGVPEDAATRAEFRLSTGQDLGVIMVMWGAPGAVNNWYSGPDLFRDARALWLHTWEASGFKYGENKGYIYTEDPLGPLAGDLRDLSMGNRTDIRVGLCFVEIGEGWYLFHTLRAGS